MLSNTETAPTSKIQLWAGRVMSALPVLILMVSATMKFVKPASFLEEFAKLGFPENLAVGLGIVELACTALYVIPRTSILGAILLTGYFGGATAAHVRIGDPYYLTVIFGMLVWGGLYLRDNRVRALIPLRS